MQTPPHSNVRPGTTTARWLAPMLLLQVATLLVALGAYPRAPQVEASQGRGIQGQEEQRDSVLPNSAAQRQEQIRLLKQVVEELSKVNEKLDQANKSLQQQKPAE